MCLKMKVSQRLVNRVFLIHSKLSIKTSMTSFPNIHMDSLKYPNFFCSGKCPFWFKTSKLFSMHTLLLSHGLPPMIKNPQSWKRFILFQVLETELGSGLLRSFIVDNKHDYDTLKQMLTLHDLARFCYIGFYPVFFFNFFVSQHP